MTGPIVNSIGIIAGSLIGATLGHRIPIRLKERLPLVFGSISMGLGISMIVKVKLFPPVILAIIIGTIIGELIKLEEGVTTLAGHARTIVEKIAKPPKDSLDHMAYMERFISVIVLFCASTTGILGALNEGMSGDPNLLIIKAILDLFTAAIFGAFLGHTLAFVAIPQFIIQAALFFAATWIMPLVSPGMLADFSAAGGIILLATGLKICGVVPFPVIGMLPSLVLIMPFSWAWLQIFP